MLPPRLAKSGGRIPSLDGLRAISISLVIFAHLVGTLHFLPPLGLFGGLGRLGVKIFFVLSGFLITTLLLQEHADSGRISLPWFYFRRTLRIFPAAYVFIAVIFILHKLDLLSLHSRDVLHALTYTTNYYIDRSWNVAHLWSLAVEEQFYLLWPAGIALLGPAKALWPAVGFFLAAPFFRTATWFLLPELREYIAYTFPAVCDSLAIGCVLALVRGGLERHDRYLRWLSSRVLWLPLVIITFSVQVSHHPLVSVAIGQTLSNLVIALWIHRSIYVHTDAIGRFLNWRPCRYVGRLSYSLYIWQQLFLNRASDSPLAAPFPVNLLCVAAAALASYYLVESPFLEMRSRLEGFFRRSAHSHKTAQAHV